MQKSTYNVLMPGTRALMGDHDCKYHLITVGKTLHLRHTTCKSSESMSTWTYTEFIAEDSHISQCCNVRTSSLVFSSIRLQVQTVSLVLVLITKSKKG